MTHTRPSFFDSLILPVYLLYKCKLAFISHKNLYFTQTEIYPNYLRSLAKFNDSCGTLKNEIPVCFVVEWFAELNLCCWRKRGFQTCSDAELFDLFPTVCVQTRSGAVTGLSATKQ